MDQEKRISRIEKMVERLSRRARKKTSAMLTPYPISACLVGEIEGEVLRYLFCADGRISRCMVSMDKKPKVGINLTVSLMGEETGRSAVYIASKRVSVYSPDIEVKAGDKLTVYAEKVNSAEEVVSELWVGFLWLPTVKEVDVKRFLIDELEKDD